jgi:uracil-DNA glycosylase
MDVRIEPGWKEVLKPEFEKAYFAGISSFLHEELNRGKVIYPPAKLIFNAFEQTPFDRLKVLLLGQDLITNPARLTVFLSRSLTVSLSLRRCEPFFTEMQNDTGIMPPAHGCLEKWAGQGVMLLNAVLTVKPGNRPHTVISAGCNLQMP